MTIEKCAVCGHSEDDQTVEFLCLQCMLKKPLSSDRIKKQNKHYEPTPVRALHDFHYDPLAVDEEVFIPYRESDIRPTQVNKTFVDKTKEFIRSTFGKSK